MKVAMMQPSFLPWQGYFELIHKADIFIFLDDFQFSLQSYHQRNRLFVNRDQVDWYTVPVVKALSFGAPLNEVQIDEKQLWQRKMLQRLQHNYAKAPFYSLIFPQLELILLRNFKSIAELNIALVKMVLSLFGWHKEIRLSSAAPSKLTRSERVLELLRSSDAKEYFSASGSFGYMLDEGKFPVTGIEVFFQNFKHQNYRQVGTKGEFIPYLSVFDALFNVGPDETASLVSGGTENWIRWSDMSVPVRIPVNTEA